MTRHMLAALACLLSLTVARAGTLQVTVTDLEGRPVPDVVVLVEPAGKVAPRPADKPVLIAQERLHFVPFLTVVPVGSTLRFSNHDGYDHHVRSTPSGPLGSMPAAKDFELRLDAAEGAAGADEYRATASAHKKAGTTWADVKVDKAGPIGLACHLHSSMRGQVYVSGTPWFAKTDANGVATIDAVPEGTADLRLWHPDQLQDQAAQHLQVTAAPMKTGAQLNFTPRRRRS